MIEDLFFAFASTLQNLISVELFSRSIINSNNLHSPLKIASTYINKIRAVSKAKKVKEG